MMKPTDSKKSKNSVYRYLPKGYEPQQFDVLCGRGRKCYFHTGNEYFRQVVVSMIPNYNSATSKIEKGYILSVIVQKIRDRAGIGGFIKKDNTNGQWYEVGDFLAREKVSQAFRDALSDKYKSSNAYKKMRREVEQTGRLFETSFLEKTAASPEASPSLQKPICNISKPIQQVAPHPKEIELKREASFNSDALFNLLDRDLEKHFQKPAATSYCMDTTDDPFEPCPIPGPNPFGRQQQSQFVASSCPNVFSGSNQPIQRRFETDNADFHSCPDLSSKQQGFQGLDFAQLLLLTAAQQKFDFAQI
eukprot:scaffold31414_cov183-Amphora_coffeaeformis.AAC.1